jgi:LuxR family maltose regulon positive regulatory protein
MSTLRESEAEGWAGLLDRWQHEEADWAGDRPTEAHAAMLRASVCRYGADEMRADVDEAVEKFAAEGIETPNLVVYRGLVSVLMGDVDRGDAVFRDAISASEGSDLQEILVCALYERAVLAMARADWTAAQAFADQLRAAFKRPGSEEVFVWIARARVAAHHRNYATARDALARAQPLRPLMTMAVFAVQNRIELARAYLDIGDSTDTRTMMQEADEILEQHDLGALVNEAAALRSALMTDRDSSGTGPSALTTAELRLLPMLCTHLTTPEIAADMFLSRHTVRSQMQSIYRKLDANNRHQAVTRARELHLLD